MRWPWLVGAIVAGVLVAVLAELAHVVVHNGDAAKTLNKQVLPQTTTVVDGLRHAVDGLAAKVTAVPTTRIVERPAPRPTVITVPTTQTVVVTTPGPVVHSSTAYPTPGPTVTVNPTPCGTSVLGACVVR